MAMTEDQWRKLESDANRSFFIVEFMIDGYSVTVQKLPIDKKATRLGLVPYVNGVMALKWLYDDCEERRRFYRSYKKFSYGKAYRAELKKLSKRLLKVLGDNPDKKTTHYSFYWPSFCAMRRHFEKHNTDISLVEGKS